jgi:hypothetical protein
MLPDTNEATFVKYFKMLVDRCTANLEVFRNRINIQWLFGDHADDLPPGRVGNCLENISSHKHKDMKPFGCGDNTTIHGVVCDI